MNIDKYIDTIKACRFCFMCRHLSGIGNVTFTEADTPRVRASLIYGATLHPEQFTDEDLIRTMYRSDLSGVCRRNCVNSYDEVGLTLAYRADIVEKGFAPCYAKEIAEELKNKPDWTISGDGKMLYIADQYSIASGAADAFAKLVKGSYKTAQGGTCGKGLWVLGFRKDAEETAKKFAAAINSANVETVVVSNPAVYDMLQNTFAEMGIKLDAKVMYSAEYLADLKVKALGDIYYLDSDFLRCYNDEFAAPRALLSANGANIKFFGTNDEESYTCGEGALVLDKIDASLVEKLAKYIEERADDPASDVIVAGSPYTKCQLAKYTSLKVKTLEELLAEAL